MKKVSKIDKVLQKLDDVNKRLDSHSETLEAHNSRLEATENLMQQLWSKQIEMDTKLNILIDRMTQSIDEAKEFNQRFKAQQIQLTDHEVRIKYLEIQKRKSK